MKINGFFTQIASQQLGWQKKEEKMTNRILLVAIVGLISCSNGAPNEVSSEPQHVRREDVARIFMNEAHSFTVLVRDGQNHVLKFVNFSTNWENSKNIKIVDNVPDGFSSWLQCSGSKRSVEYGGCESIELHVHSVGEINGGAWHHGKSGRGKTNVVE